MPCSRTPVDLFTNFDIARLLGVAFVAIYLLGIHTLLYVTRLNHFTPYALRPALFLSTLRDGRYLPPRKTRYKAPFKDYLGGITTDSLPWLPLAERGFVLPAHILLLFYRPLTHASAKLLSAYQMYMQMKNRLPTLFACIDDTSITLGI